MKFILMALAVSALAACVTAPAETPPHDAPHPSDTCILLERSQQAIATDDGRMTNAESTILRRIQTTVLPGPTYRCGDASYQTGRAQLGFSISAIGFGAGHGRHYARVDLQRVAGPLSGVGESCLYEAKDQSWELRGCDIEWVS